METGEYKAVFHFEYGIFQLERETLERECTFMVGVSDYDVQKSIVLTPSLSTIATVRISVKNRSGSADAVTITDTIPKELAASTNDIEFITPPSEILEDDPVVEWSMNLPVGGDAEIVYRVHTPLSPEEIELLPLPAATLTPSLSPDRFSSSNFIGDEGGLTQTLVASLLYLKDTINGLPDSSFTGGTLPANDARGELSARIERARSSILDGDLIGALMSFVNLFAPTAGGEPSIDDWITNKDAQSLILSIFDNTASLMRLIGFAHNDRLPPYAPPKTTISLDGNAGKNGWYTSDVTVTLTATDPGGSGIADITYRLDDGEQVITPSSTVKFKIEVEGRHILTYYATNDIGSREKETSREINIDKTPPTITMTAPLGKANYYINQLVTASYSCSDALSDVAGYGGTVPSGSYIDTGTVGSKIFTVKATDSAGNEVTETITYNVIYRFSGFLPPLISGKTYKAGSTIPVKFRLIDANGKYISTAQATIDVDGKPGQSSGSSNDGNTFRNDDEQYIFNLSTKDLSKGDHKITVKLDDDTTYSIDITLK